MLCPHCGKEIDDREIARHWAAKGGRTVSPEKREQLRKNLAKARERRWPAKPTEPPHN